jgi:phenylalanine-4-hydroxylase
VFEEAQLYSPVTTDAGGEVTVHLHHGHPGADDPDYRRRRNEIAAAALAWRPGEPAPKIDYLPAEQDVWRTLSS